MRQHAGELLDMGEPIKERLGLISEHDPDMLEKRCGEVRGGVLDAEPRTPAIEGREIVWVEGKLGVRRPEGASDDRLSVLVPQPDVGDGFLDDDRYLVTSDRFRNRDRRGAGGE